MNQRIRFATTEDSEEILSIYSKYILETAVSFEIELPSLHDFTRRIQDIIEIYPYLVLECDNHIEGFAYASTHAQRAAYCYDVNLSVYMSDHFQGKGMAKLLYQGLFALLKEQGYYNAFVAYSEPNEKSALFHEKLGFQQVGTFPKAGYKLGRWHDLTWAEKALQEHSPTPKELRKITQLSPDYVQSVLEEVCKI